MDSKKPNQYRALKKLISLICIMSMLSCTWVKDDNDDCRYGFWLKLCYTYNILDVEAAPEYVTEACVYIYDAEGNYVKRLDVSQSLLLANNHLVRVEGLPEGDYQFVVWSGISNSQYAVSGDLQTMSDFRLSLADQSTNYANELPALYYGRLETVHYDDKYALYDVEMMKNTNQLACLVVSISDDVELTPDDYTMKVVAANGIMDAYNEPLPDTEITYEPYIYDTVTIDDPDYGELHGVKFGISTLRLMSDMDYRIVFERIGDGQQIFNISLPEYVGMIGSLYTNLGRPLSTQEYLDRQDFYTVVFYLSDNMINLIQLKVNSWRLRANNHLKL